MPTDELFILYSPVHKGIQAPKVELSLRRFRGVPFSTASTESAPKPFRCCLHDIPVLRGHLSKVGHNDSSI